MSRLRRGRTPWVLRGDAGAGGAVAIVVVITRFRRLRSVCTTASDRIIDRSRVREFHQGECATERRRIEENRSSQVDSGTNSEGSGRWGRLCWREFGNATRQQNINADQDLTMPDG